MSSLEAIRHHFNTSDPFSNHLGIEIIEVAQDFGVAVMPLDKQHRNGMGIAHGGAIFALADMAFGAVSCAAGLYCVNSESNISYLAAGRIGPLRAEARRIRKGRNLGTYEVRITDSDKTLVAVARITGFFTKHVVLVPDAAERAQVEK